MGIEQSLGTRLGIFVHIVVLNLSKVPSLIVVEKSLEVIYGVVKGESDFSDPLTILLLLYP